MNIRFGIVCPSEIALRRFLPALTLLEGFEFAGVAFANKSEWLNADDEIISREKEKAQHIVDQFGGHLFYSYKEIISASGIDALYIPLPPALHYNYARAALMAGKHVLVEKPATILLQDTEELIQLAISNNLALHENYMFVFHDQLQTIIKIMDRGEIGEVRLFRISFGFPRKSTNDFRYDKFLGGGALLDAGGYTLKLAKILLGESAELVCAHSEFTNDFTIDISGSAMMVNNSGTPAQISFGMDNFYKCDLEVWGSKGYLVSARILTAPPGFVPQVTIFTEKETKVVALPADDAFKKSILHFQKCILNQNIRQETFLEMIGQAKLVEQFTEKSSI